MRSKSKKSSKRMRGLSSASSGQRSSSARPHPISSELPFAKRRRIIDPSLLERVSRIPCLACPQWPEEQLRDYLDALRSGVKADRISDPHHVTSRGAGGGDTADNVMPLCREHHNEWDAPFTSPSFVIAAYPRIRAWLEAAGRKDVLDRYCPQTEERPMTESAPSRTTLRPVGTTLDKEIAFKLTIVETAEKAQEMAALDGEILKLEQEKKEFDAAISEKIKERYARMSSIARVVRDKKEVRLASVIMEKVFATNTVAYWFSENGTDWAVVEERAMEANERQMDIADAGVPVGTIPSPKKKLRTKGPAPKEENEIAKEIRSETNRKSKRSAVDGVYP